MADFEHVDIAKAFADLIQQGGLRDGNRTVALQEIRRLTQGRIYSGRRPQRINGTWLSITVVGEDPQYTMQGGRSDNSRDFVEFTMYSNDPAERTRLKHAVVMALDNLQSVAINNTVICSCRQESGGDTEDRRPDASDTYDFGQDVTFVVKYKRLVPEGFI